MTEEIFSGCRLRYVGRLRPLRPFYDLELNGIALLQRTITVTRDRSVMDKNVGTVVTANESETFRVIEPLDLTLQTDSPPLSSNRPQTTQMGPTP